MTLCGRRVKIGGSSPSLKQGGGKQSLVQELRAKLNPIFVVDRVTKTFEELGLDGGFGSGLPLLGINDESSLIHVLNEDLFHQKLLAFLTTSEHSDGSGNFCRQNGKPYPKSRTDPNFTLLMTLVRSVLLTDGERGDENETLFVVLAEDGSFGGTFRCPRLPRFLLPLTYRLPTDLADNEGEIVSRRITVVKLVQLEDSGELAFTEEGV